MTSITSDASTNDDLSLEETPLIPAVLANTPPPMMPTTSTPTVEDYDTQILALQQQIDRDRAQIRHLVATRAVAIEHERALRKIDDEYRNPTERKKILERVSEDADGGDGKAGGGKMVSGEGGKVARKDKPGLILYGKRAVIKRDVRKEPAKVKKDAGSEEKPDAVTTARHLS